MKALFVTAALVSATVACAQEPGATTGWPFVGSDQAHTKYSVAEEADTNQVCENSGNDPRVDVEYSNNCPYGATRVMFREAGGPGAVEALESELGPIPLTKPPYAHLVAIDLNAGEIAWKVPFGEGSDEIRTHPLLGGVDLPERLGTLGNSGPLATKGGWYSSAAATRTCMRSTMQRVPNSGVAQRRFQPARTR